MPGLPLDGGASTGAPLPSQPAGEAAALARKRLGPGGTEAFKAAAAHCREKRLWCGDHTTFSALGLDCGPPRGHGSTRMSWRLQALELDVGLRAPAPSDKAPSKASVRSVDTALPDSDGEGPCDSDSGSYATDTSSGEHLPVDSGPSFHQVRSLLLSFRRGTLGTPSPELRGLTAEGVAKAPGGRSAPVRRPDHCMLPSSPAVQHAPAKEPTPTPTSACAAVQTGAATTPAGLRKRGGRGGGTPAGSSDAERARGASAQAWHAPSQGQEEELKRSVQSLLNKVCPENIATVSQKIAALGIKEARHLEILVEFIFTKALAEPHYCETYADLVFDLQTSLPGIAPQGGSGPALTLRSALLGVCQREFEGMLASMDLAEEEEASRGPEQLEDLRKSRRDRLRANVRLIGHLFLRKLLATRVVGRLACELTNCDNEEDVPEEHAIECACELLLSVGHTLDSHPAGAELLQCICERMRRLKDRKSEPEGKKGVYCRRVQFAIQDLLETREAGWSKRLFRSAAKTLEEVRLQQAREMLLAKSPSRGEETPGAEQVVVGLRPAYLSAVVAGG